MNVQSYDKSSAEFKALFSKLHKHTETSGFSVSFLPARSASFLFSKLTDHHRDLQEDTLYNPDVHFAHWAGLAKHV